MRYKGIILNLGKEEIGEIQDEIEGKTESKIKDKFNDEDRKNYLIKDNQEMNKNQKSASPIISIVTPYYNGQDYIDETARSVLNQTFTNFEWIIVDDGSTKEGKEKLKEIEKLDDRIKLINTGENKNESVLNEEDIDEYKNLPSKNLLLQKRTDSFYTSKKEPVPNVRSCWCQRPWNKKFGKKF